MRNRDKKVKRVMKQNKCLEYLLDNNPEKVISGGLDKNEQ